MWLYECVSVDIQPQKKKKKRFRIFSGLKSIWREIWIRVVKRDGLVIESKAAVCSALSCLWVSFADRRCVLALYGKLLTGKQICFCLDLLRFCCQYLCDAMWLYGAQDEMRSSENEKIWELKAARVSCGGCRLWWLDTWSLLRLTQTAPIGLSLMIWIQYMRFDIDFRSTDSAS